jgi:Ca2+-binding RTX toxin-like protein
VVIAQQASISMLACFISNVCRSASAWGARQDIGRVKSQPWNLSILLTARCLLTLATRLKNWRITCVLVENSRSVQIQGIPSDGQSFLLPEMDDDFSGVAVSDAGDVNGDGLGGVIVGAYEAAPNGGSSGAAYVVFGRHGAFSASISTGELDGTKGFALHGVDAGDAAGRAVAEAGDINGDGFFDLLVGAPAADPTARTNAGEAYLLFGRDYLASVTHQGDRSGNDLLGDSGANTIVGAQGSDRRPSGGGADVLLGGQGDDEVILVDESFRRVAGGPGFDSVRVDGSGITLDLTQLPDNSLTTIRSTL